MSPSTESAAPDSTGAEEPLSGRFTPSNASDVQDDGGLVSREDGRGSRHLRGSRQGHSPSPV
jgi:hypothetical protein